MLRRITSLFVDQAPGLSEDHVRLFDDVLARLARDVEFRARLELSERVASLSNGPQRTIRDLALDDNIGVARPVLERSPRLTEADLVDVARAKGQEHLLALSRRSSLSEPVTNVLVRRGDGEVAASVAANAGARVSSRDVEALIERARSDPHLRQALERRAGLDGVQLRRLVEIAQAAVAEKLQGELGPAADGAIRHALERAGETVARDRRTLPPSPGIPREVADAAGNGELDERQVAAWLAEGEVDLALAAMAQLAGVPLGMVRHAYEAVAYDPLLFIVRSLKFGWGTFKLCLVARAGGPPPADTTRSAFEGFQQLSVATAQRVVRFTAARDHASRGTAA
jgi:uncharacterized protein (DUF2336 family)